MSRGGGTGIGAALVVVALGIGLLLGRGFMAGELTAARAEANDLREELRATEVRAELMGAMAAMLEGSGHVQATNFGHARAAMARVRAHVDRAVSATEEPQRQEVEALRARLIEIDRGIIELKPAVVDEMLHTTSEIRRLLGE